MTSTNKPVTRRTLAPFMHYGRRMVVTLGPGDTISIRLERERASRGLVASLSGIYTDMVRRKVRADQAGRKGRRGRAKR